MRTLTARDIDNLEEVKRTLKGVAFLLNRLTIADEYADDEGTHIYATDGLFMIEDLLFSATKKLDKVGKMERR